MKYTVNPISEHITQIIDPTEVSSFLVIGDHSAVLIDTGIGICGLKKTVESLTDKPYRVLLTHGHGDHAGGCSAFPDVYIAKADIPLLYSHGMEMRLGYCQLMFSLKEQMTGEKTDFDPVKDMEAEPSPDKEFNDLTYGMTFDLGGISVEAISVPGHTKGSFMMLVPEERTILYGDCCNSNTLVGGNESTSISQYQESLKRLLTMKDRYDTTLYSHGPAIGPTYSLEDNIELCNKILAGTDDHIPTQGFSGPGYLAAKRKDPVNRADGRCGNIFYSELTLA